MVNQVLKLYIMLYKIVKFSLFSIFLCLSATIEAQLQRPNIPVQRMNGAPYLHPWAGGLNNPQFSEVDIDGDGVKDLFVFDRVGNVPLTFINGGTANTIDYSFAPEWRSQFPSTLQNFVLLRDYNCDGLEDLFTYYYNTNTGEAGISVYKASRNGANLVEYQLAKDILRFNLKGQTQLFNLYVSTIDIPAIDDIDGDGDLDILTFNPSGGYVELYQNNSVENGWNCDSLRFVYADNCWGRFYESGVNINLDLSPNIDSCYGWNNWSPLRPSNNSGPRHAGSTLLTLDMDNDGDKELILGDLTFDNLNLITNGGNSDTAFASAQEVNFPQNSTTVAIDIFPAAFFLDVNNDNKKDLIASPNFDNISVNDRVAWLYTNSQSTTQPLFNYQQQDFLVDEMIEHGSTAAPSFVDFDGDGLLDLVIGNYGIRVNASTYRTRLVAYQNIGTSTTPIFKLFSLDFASLQQYNFKRLAPSFGDMDNDGDLDMVIGQEDGTLLYVQNTGTATSPSFATPFQYTNIDVGQHATPTLANIDRDGDLDLIIGERNGNINYYENTGTASLAAFSTTANTETFGFIDARMPGFSEGNSAPIVWDNNGSYHLFVGNETGQVWVYTNIEGNLLGTFQQLSGPHDSISEGKQSILAVADLTNDGQPELVVGNKRGGVAIFSAPLPSSVKPSFMAHNFDAKIWPNPTTGSIFLAFDDVLPETISLELYDVLGHLIKDAELPMGIDTYEMLVDELHTGLYFLLLRGASGTILMSQQIEKE